MYHKDEYNKEQKFYDDAHKHGKYDKYGGKHKDYTNKDVGHKHGKHHETGYDEAHKGASGHFNKGGYHEGHRGHSGESGHKSHNDHKAEYDTLSDNKKYGEHEGGAGVGDDFYWVVPADSSSSGEYATRRDNYNPNPWTFPEITAQDKYFLFFISIELVFKDVYN